MTRKAVFVSAGRTGSAVLRGVQTVKLLRRRGADAVLRAPTSDLDGLRDATVVFVKTFPAALADRLRRRGNRIVLDWIDPHHPTCIRPDGSRRVLDAEHAETLDGLLCVNRTVLADAEAEGVAPRALRRWIPHPFDLRCRRYLPRRDRFSLVYLGHSGVRIAGGVRRIVLARHRAGLLDFVRLSSYTCHVALRDPTGLHEAESEGIRALAFRSKSNIKLSTAAALGANVVATRDPGCMDLLDEDYPYLAGSVSEGLEVIHKARQEYGSGRWRLGLEQMRAVRERTHPLRVAADYEAFLAELSA